MRQLKTLFILATSTLELDAACETRVADTKAVVIAVSLALLVFTAYLTQTKQVLASFVEVATADVIDPLDDLVNGGYGFVNVTKRIHKFGGYVDS